MVSKILCHLSRNVVQPNVCIIGSGPGGFYVAHHLFRHMPNTKIDMFEKLPVPFGLVRYGIAPDHADAKNVENTFSKIASSENFSFYGNVNVGNDVPFKDFKHAYHAVVLSYGCSEEKKIGIIGEETTLSAKNIVGWYNGLPENKNLDINLDCENAIIVGQGNVAIDVARILLTPVDLLKTTDITDYALERLSKSKIKNVFMVGRRGPLQAAFTIKEFRQMIKLPGVRTIFRPSDLAGLQELIPNLERPRKRLTELILTTASTQQVGEKTFHPTFFRKPLEANCSHMKFCVTSLRDNSSGIVEDTEVIEEIDASLQICSVGYKGISIDPELPFDNAKGIVIPQPGVYASGWISTGPVGVINSTMSNAFKTAKTIADDFQRSKLNTEVPKPGSEHIRSILKRKGVRTVSFKGWERINQKELERGAKLGKLRQKIVDIEEMLEIGGE